MASRNDGENPSLCLSNRDIYEQSCEKTQVIEAPGENASALRRHPSRFGTSTKCFMKD